MAAGLRGVVQGQRLGRRVRMGDRIGVRGQDRKDQDVNPGSGHWCGEGSGPGSAPPSPRRLSSSRALCCWTSFTWASPSSVRAVFSCACVLPPERGRGGGETSEIFLPDHRTRPSPQAPPLGPQVSQQLLQAPTSSFKTPSAAVCFEAGKTPARPVHAESPSGTRGTPFSTPGPAPRTLGYPPTYSQTREALVCTHRLLSAGPGARATPRAVWRLWREVPAGAAPGTRELSPRPRSVATTILGHTEGAGRCTAHRMRPNAEQRQVHGATHTHSCTHVGVHTAPRCTRTVRSHGFTLSPRLGPGTQLGHPGAEGRI